ncbi:MAG: hypothetical protein CVU63_10165, partial [Deltaproteobacteria bacterium HGW-Deltaproteobacteria-20]
MLTRAGRDPVLMLRPARLEVMEGPDKGLVADVRESVVRVGTSERCDVVLTDPAVSTNHFEISVMSTGRVLRDLGSTGPRPGHRSRPAPPYSR